jgi:protocatechuate 3,4-dioxygenase, alpha subunit
MALPATPSQTVGPFFACALPHPLGAELVKPGDPRALRLVGEVRDGEGAVVPDAMLEIWQANAAGRYAHPDDHRDHVPLEDGFTGFGRAYTDDDGRFAFVTVKPGRVPGPDGTPQAPHIAVSVFARGLLQRLVTRVYFPDEAEANAADPVLAAIEDSRLRESLVARPEGPRTLRFDVHLQGDRQTAFFGL